MNMIYINIATAKMKQANQVPIMNLIPSFVINSPYFFFHGQHSFKQNKNMHEITSFLKF